MARTRFEDNKEIPVGAKAMMADAAGGSDAVDMVPASTFANKNPHTIRFFDPSLSEKQAIKRI